MGLVETAEMAGILCWSHAKNSFHAWTKLCHNFLTFKTCCKALGFGVGFCWKFFFFCFFPESWDGVNDRSIVLFVGVMLILWLESLAGYQQSG